MRNVAEDAEADEVKAVIRLSGNARSMLDRSQKDA
jgi:hypothetical protein